MRTLYLLLADLILVAHALIVFFNVGALPVIWIGYFRKWGFVRNLGFRIMHVLLIAFVAAQSLLGDVCPLTTWENTWLIKAGVGPRYQRDYIGHWLHELLFYEADPKVFTVAYVLFFVLVLLTFILVQPRLPRRRAGNAPTATASNQ
jgi:hypothetical protein